MSPNITWDFVQQNIRKPWSYSNLLQNPNVTFEIAQQIKSHKKFHNKHFDMYSFSENPNITWEIIQQYPEFDWNYKGLSANPNITPSIVCQNPDKRWSWSKLSNNKNITCDFVHDTFNEQWDWITLSAHPFDGVHGPYCI